MENDENQILANNLAKQLNEETKMKDYEIKEVYVESAPSKNFQKHTVGMTIILPTMAVEEESATIRKAQALCRRLAYEQIELDKQR